MTSPTFLSQSRTQQALVLEGPSGPFAIHQIPIPTPKSGEVVVKIHSAGLNPADWKIPKYHILVNDFPAIIGSDIAGEILQVGEGVSGFQVGDKVLFQAQDWKLGGAFQQYVAAASDTLSKIPENISYDEAVTLPVAIATASSGLYSKYPRGLGVTSPATSGGNGKYAGVPIVVLGGAGAVGQAIIQLAKISGFSLIITTASLRNAGALQALGATHVLDRNSPTSQILDEIKIATTNKPVEYIYDVVASESTQKLSMEIISKSGKGKVAFPIPESFFAISSKDFPSVAIATVEAHPRALHNLELFQSLFQGKLYEWIETGLIVPNRHQLLPGGLNGVLDGLKMMELDQVSRLKLVIHPQETN